MNDLEHIVNRATGWPVRAEGDLVKRVDSCSFCSATTGFNVATADYWDLTRVSYIRCSQCELIQVDPMLSREITAKGCEAYYWRELVREGKRNRKKNMTRSFRKGVYFGRILKKRGISPKQILEAGPGDGYFSRGVQFVFPDAAITCLDIVDVVLKDIKARHGFSTLLGTPEELIHLIKQPRFDLIIARDIIEHVGDPSRVFEAFSQALLPGGHFHFITPNGYEDIWTAYCHTRIKGLPSEMLINHVNFFPPLSLRQNLLGFGFEPLLWFIYDFNGTRWGRARRISKGQMAPTSKKLSARATIESCQNSPDSKFEIQDHEIMKRWWLRPSHRWITYAYCFWKEKHRFTLPADIGIGHEIFGLFKKVGDHFAKPGGSHTH